MVVLAILFWLWFLTSVVILVRRSIRRRRERRIRRDATRVALHDDAATDSEAELPEAIEAPVIAPAPVAAPPAPTRAAPAPATVAAAAPATGESPANVATMARAAAAPVTVAQVIAGIEMPCGLVPLTLSDHDMRYDRGQRAHFVTTLVPADAVMANLGEELERIGLTVTPIGDTAAIAKRGRLAVELRVSTVGALVDGVASVEFRSAPANSVVVDFDVVPV
jgi:hypothetical protein